MAKLNLEMVQVSNKMEPPSTPKPPNYTETDITKEIFELQYLVKYDRLHESNDLSIKHILHECRNNDLKESCNLLFYAMKKKKLKSIETVMKVITEYVNIDIHPELQETWKVIDECIDFGIDCLCNEEDHSGLIKLYLPVFLHSCLNEFRTSSLVVFAKKLALNSEFIGIMISLLDIAFSTFSFEKLKEMLETIDKKEENIYSIFLEQWREKEIPDYDTDTMDQCFQIWDKLQTMLDPSSLYNSNGVNPYFKLLYPDYENIFMKIYYSLKLKTNDDKEISKKLLKWFKGGNNSRNALHWACTHACFRKLSNLIKEDVFLELFHEKCNGSNCLNFLFYNWSLIIKDKKCRCNNDKLFKCDFNFFQEHVEHKCYHKMCISIFDCNDEEQTFLQLIEFDDCLEVIKMLLKLGISVKEIGTLLDNTCFISRSAANSYIENACTLDKAKAKNETYKKNVCAEIIRKLWSNQKANLMKNFISSKYFDYFSNNSAKILNEHSTEIDIPKKLLKTEHNHSLLYLALRSEKYKLFEILLVQDQIEIIPNCVRVMLFCQYTKMVGDGKLNNNIDILQEFCQTVLHNAIAELFRGASKTHLEMSFRYLTGTLNWHNKDTGTTVFGPLFSPFCHDSDNNKSCNEVKQISILQMIEDLNVLSSMDHEFHKDSRFRRLFTLPSFIKLQEWMWKGRMYSNDSKQTKCCYRGCNGRVAPTHRDLDNEENIDDVAVKQSEKSWYGPNVHFGFKIVIDFFFLSIYTIYLLTGMYDHVPFRRPISNVTSFWPKEKETDVTYYETLLANFLPFVCIVFESLLVLYWIGIVLEEFEEIIDIIKKLCYLLDNNWKFRYFKKLWFDVWNLADFFYILMFGLFIGMRVVFYLRRLQEPDKSYQHRHGALSTHFISLFWIRIVAAIAYVCICFRRMQHVCMIFKSMGVLYITFQQLIIRDMRPFLTMLAINIFSFGVFFHVLLNPGSLSFFPNGTIDQHKLINLLNVYSRPLMVAFGEYMIDDTFKCFSLDTLGDEKRAFPTIEFKETDECSHPAGTFLYAYFAIFIYMLIVNLTLFNLLIARFSLTVTRYNEEAISLYYWDLYRQWKDLRDNGKFNTSPVNFIMLPFKFFGSSCYETCSKQNEKTDQQQIFQENDVYLQFLHYQAASFCNKRETFTNPIYESARDVDCAVHKLQLSVSEKLNNMNDTVMAVSGRMDRIEDSLKKIHLHLLRNSMTANAKVSP